VKDITATATPEPGTFGMMLIGLVALGTLAAVRKWPVVGYADLSPKHHSRKLPDDVN